MPLLYRYLNIIRIFPERSDQASDVSSVAFTAVLNSRLSNYAAKTTIVFGNIITNIGNGYNPIDGVFTAPCEGVYQFSATILADNSGEVWCGFMKNGKRLASVYARASDNRHDQGAMTIILQLSKGRRQLNNKAIFWVCDQAEMNEAYSTKSD